LRILAVLPPSRDVDAILRPGAALSSLSLATVGSEPVWAGSAGSLCAGAASAAGGVTGAAAAGAVFAAGAGRAGCTCPVMQADVMFGHVWAAQDGSLAARRGSDVKDTLRPRETGLPTSSGLSVVHAVTLRRFSCDTT
jgi:hypothetical protein